MQQVEVVNEFELIAHYFSRSTMERQGIGDDCALIDIRDTTLALTTDLLLEGRHFFSNVDPESLGHKSLAVNLSDLAAAGAKPRCFLLSIALPRADECWLTAFSRGLFALAEQSHCALIGGDTTRVPNCGVQPGPITINIVALGEVPRQYVRGRQGARIGDELWVSGQLGDAALALAHLQGRVSLDAAGLTRTRLRLERPQPHLALGQALHGLATACIDVSDGLIGDLQHLMRRSQLGAQVQVDALPASGDLAQQPVEQRRLFQLAGGDDYELLFTAAATQHDQVLAAGQATGTVVTHIGRMIEMQPDQAGPVLLDQTGRVVQNVWRAFDHFA